MKTRTIIAACFIAASPAVAHPADLLAKRAKPQPLPPTIIIGEWEGFYAGAHAGGAWARTSTSDRNPANGNAGARFTASPTGFLGGIQAGYNWQRNAVVFGVEADLGYLGLRGSTMRDLSLQAAAPAATPAAAAPPVCNNIRGCAAPQPAAPVQLAPPPLSPTSLRTDGGAYATLRGRIGLTSGRFLFFATGGLFAADLNSHLQSQDGLLATGKTGWGLGWTAGGGVEVAMSEKLRLKVDYLHFAMGSQRVSGTVNGVIRPFEIKHQGDMVRVGLNYRF